MTAPYRAVIFDMDGVLVDSEPVFFEAVNELLKPSGKRIEWEDYQQLLGTRRSHTWRHELEIAGMAARQRALDRSGDAGFT